MKVNMNIVPTEEAEFSKTFKWYQLCCVLKELSGKCHTLNLLNMKDRKNCRVSCYSFINTGNRFIVLVAYVFKIWPH